MTTKISGGLIKTATITGNNIAANTISATNIRNDVNIGGPKISSLTYADDDTAANPAGGETITINGSGFLTGATVLLESVSVGSVTVVDANTITFTAPAKATGSYIVYVVNTDGSTAILVPGIQYSGVPSWTTAAGSLGSAYETASIAATLVATGDAPLTYSVVSGTLPTGATLASNGQLSGTAPVDGSSTTYTFTVRASDAQNQETDRQFSITINTDVVTWSSPANNATYTWAQNSANTLSLSATSAAGYSVSYAANSLPTGLSISGSTLSGTPTAAGNSSSLITATAATTGRTAALTLNWVIQVAGDTFWKNNILLLSANSAAVTNLFINDASSNNNTITVVADARPSNINPYQQGFYSNYFDGTGDYLTIADNAAFEIGSNVDFTVEAWFNISSLPSSGDFADIVTKGAGGVYQPYYLFVNSSGSLLYYSSSSGSSWDIASAVSLGTILVNNWYHVAVSREGTNTRLFLNGVLINTITNSGAALYDNTRAVAIGGRSDGTETQLVGYISNVRIVKGTAVYTAAFTPPTSPLTAIANTQLLTCQSSRLIDNSVNNFTVTKNGDVAVRAFQPFAISNTEILSYGSAYFDGTNDKLTIPGNTAITAFSGNFTIELWVYPTAYGTYFPYVSQFFSLSGGVGSWFFASNSSGGHEFYYDGQPYITYGSQTVKLNNWNHIALVKSGTTVTCYVNGQSAGSGTVTNAVGTTNSPIEIGGSSFNESFGGTGYISNLRILKGTALYTTSFTPPTAALTAIANTTLLTLQYNGSHNNNTFRNRSGMEYIITKNGNVTQGTFSPYGDNWSNYFDGVGDNLLVTVPAIGTKDFTFEAWVNRTGSTGGNDSIFSINSSSGLYVQFYQTNVRIWMTGLSGSFIGYDGVVSNKWYHIAFTRSGNTARLFLDGTLRATGTTTGNITDTNAYIGTTDGNNNMFTGFVSNLRLVVGNALYTSSFTPSTGALTAVGNTTLLTCQSNRLMDASPFNRTITKTGEVRVQKFSPFSTITTPKYYSIGYGTKSDYISIPSVASITTFAGNFTIEGWVFPTDTSIEHGIIDARQTGASAAPWVIGLAGYNNGWVISYWDGTSYTSTSRVQANVWTHVAMERVGSTVTFYINGTASGTFTKSGTITGGSSTVYIGSKDGGLSGYGTVGSISNFRIVNGTAVYGGDFTPPTSPLTAIANTTLLVAQSNSFVDSSTVNHALTVSSNTISLSAFSPFTPSLSSPTDYTPDAFGGSVYFDGTGDYLTIPSTSTATTIPAGAFTWETWIYPISTGTAAILYGTWNNGSAQWAFEYSHGGLWGPGARLLIYNGNYGSNETALYSTTQLNLNTWSHIAWVRNSSNTISLYVNGRSQTLSEYNPNAQWSNSFTYTTGQLCGIGGTANYNSFKGYLSDMRYTQGAALYTGSFIPPYTPLSSVQTIRNNAYSSVFLLPGTNGGVIDTTRTIDLETVGDTRITRFSPYSGNGNSYYFDGTGDFLLSSPNILDIGFGESDFTVEFWVYFIVARDTGFLGSVGNGGFDFAWQSNALSIGRINTAWDVTFSWTPVAGRWYHVAYTRSGSSVRGFIDGTQIGTTATNTTSYNPVSGMVVGASTSSPDRPLSGYLTDIRLTKGYARYTTNFTPPTEPYLIK